jgi:hypothetical protein
MGSGALSVTSSLQGGGDTLFYVHNKGVGMSDNTDNKKAGEPAPVAQREYRAGMVRVSPAFLGSTAFNAQPTPLHIIPRPKNRDLWGGAGCDRDEVVIL